MSGHVLKTHAMRLGPDEDTSSGSAEGQWVAKIPISQLSCFSPCLLFASGSCAELERVWSLCFCGLF